MEKQKQIMGTCKPMQELVQACYVKPSRYHVWRKHLQAQEAREYVHYHCRYPKHDKPEPKKNRPYYRALENKKWRF